MDLQHVIQSKALRLI